MGPARRIAMCPLSVAHGDRRLFPSIDRILAHAGCHGPGMEKWDA
jgi:hypothetical protein